MKRFLYPCVMVLPICAYADQAATFRDALEAVRPQLEEIGIAQMSKYCAAELADTYEAGESYSVEKIFADQVISAMLERSSSSAEAEAWREYPVFAATDTFLPEPAKQHMLTTISGARFVIDTLQFKALFDRVDAAVSLTSPAEIGDLRARLVASKAHYECMLGATREVAEREPFPLLDKQGGAVNAALHCEQMFLIVDRYLAVDVLAMSVEERRSAGDEIVNDHEAYLQASGIAAECTELS